MYTWIIGGPYNWTDSVNRKSDVRTNGHYNLAAGRLGYERLFGLYIA